MQMQHLLQSALRDADLIPPRHSGFHKHCLSPEVILIHNLLVLGRFAFSAAGPSLFHFDMLACLLPSTGAKSGIQWCTAAVFLFIFFARLIETVFSKCDQAGTHHVESGQHGLNNLLNA